MGAALVVSYSVQFVDNDRADRFQHTASGDRSQKYEQRFGRGHQYVGWPTAHLGTLGLRGISGADRRTDTKWCECPKCPGDSGERCLQVAVDVV